MRIVRSYSYNGYRGIVYCDKCLSQGKRMFQCPSRQDYPRIKCIACGHIATWSRGIRFYVNRVRL